MSDVVVVTVCNERRALMLAHTVSEYIQKGAPEHIVNVLGRILF
jgi:hypothetical protein